MQECIVSVALDADNFYSKNTTYDLSNNQEEIGEARRVHKRGTESRPHGVLQEAEKATQATLQTLAERLAEDEPHNLASQLPLELAEYISYEGEEIGTPFSLDGFFERVTERDGGWTGLTPSTMSGW
jgi:uncharacterized protein (DUF2267 family)